MKYDLKIVQVVHVDKRALRLPPTGTTGTPTRRAASRSTPTSSAGCAFNEAVDAVARALHKEGLGEKLTTWRLRDWGVSRQRYWGTPIPIIHCAEHGAVPVPAADQLPVLLPTDCVPDGSGNPLEQALRCVPRRCGVSGLCSTRRGSETDTMDTFVDSSWYFMRYCDPNNDRRDGCRRRRLTGCRWTSTSAASSTRSCTCLYARFWTKVMRDLGLVKIDEPFTRLLTQGMVLNQIWLHRDEHGGRHYHPPAEVTPVLDGHGRIEGGRLADGSLVEFGGIGKMGKSERNGVDPQQLIDKYGADTARLYTMFTAPPEAHGSNGTTRRSKAATVSCAGSGRSGTSLVLLKKKLEQYSKSQALRVYLTIKIQALRRELHTRAQARSTTTTSACSTTPSSPAR